MANDSSTGGYILPSPAPAPQPTEDAALDNFLQGIVKSTTGMDGTKVFPRWQVNPPNLPDVTVNWASIGIMNQPADANAYETHNPVFLNPFPPTPTPAPTPAPNGFDIQIRHELLEILCSFYGPNARSNASLLRDGLQVAQNREAMQLARMGFVSSGDIQTVPALINNKWYYRVDLPFVIRREVVRYYPILDIVSAEITLQDDQGITITKTIEP